MSPKQWLLKLLNSSRSPSTWPLGWGKIEGSCLFFFKCLMIITSLSIPGVVLFNTAWIKGGTCLSGTPFGWASASLKARVTCQPPALPRASLLGCPESFTRSWLLLIRDHLNAAGPSPCPLGSSRLHKNSPNSGMQKAFPALRGGVGREGEHSPPAPSLFLRGLCFLRNFNLSPVVCVTT